MEWVETVAKTLAEARELALDRLGVGEEDAEFEVLEEPKAGLFGRVRGEARVRARVRPTAVRPKQDRRSRARNQRGERPVGEPAQVDALATVAPDAEPAHDLSSGVSSGGSATRGRHGKRNRSKQQKELSAMANDDQGADDRSVEKATEAVDPKAVGEAAVEFMTGLTEAFGASATASLHVEGSELDVRVDGDDLGLLIGPGGRTLAAVQDLARVAAQRRLGDHDTRLRIDVAGYRERRRAALERFAVAVAHEVRETGRTKALEPMASADRKVVHDSIHGIEGVASHSDGEEPRRRVVITPA
jgi:spoIIIJ-associated protein